MRFAGMIIGMALLGLAALTPARADTFRIEIDYMVDDSANAHTHLPTQAELDAVIRMFACQGHTLIIDVSDAIPHHDVLQMDPATPGRVFAYAGVDDSYGAIKSAYYDHAGQAGWHYCLFAHQYEWVTPEGVYYDSTSSGLAELGGDDLMVTLGAFTWNGLPTGSPYEKAATLAHEFGHNLGLSHCGDMDCGSDPDTAGWTGPYVLNVASVMSYFYQLVGVRSNLVCQGLAPEFIPFKNMDYSHGTMCTLDENALNEELGTLMAAADWNCDGGIDNGFIAADLNGGSREHWCGPGLINGTFSVLSDFDEWSAIFDATKSLASADLKEMPVITCVSFDEVKAVRDKLACPQPVLATEDCLTAEMRYVRGVGSPGASGSCTDAFGTVTEAAQGYPAGTVLIIEPGTWDEGPLVLSTPGYLISAQTAVIR